MTTTKTKTMDINTFCASQVYVPAYEDSEKGTWFILTQQILEAVNLPENIATRDLLSKAEYRTKMPAYARGERDAWHFVSESGLYKLILLSKAPAFQRFTTWALQIVLPIAAEDGFYVMREEQFFLPPACPELMLGSDLKDLFWLSETVLPEIRRDGGYAALDHLLAMKQHLESDDAAEAVTKLLEDLKGHRSRKILHVH